MVKMVKERIITKADLDSMNFLKEDSLEFDGDITFEENLGRVRIKKSVKLTGYLLIKAGSGIEAGEGIKAGEGIEAGLGIEAGWGIKAGSGIKAGWGIKAGLGIEAGWGIEAGSGIKAGEGIEAGLGIEAGEGIKAGWGIKAGDGIITFRYGGIIAKFISALRIAVGFNITKEQVIKAEIRKGKVILGEVKKV